MPQRVSFATTQWKDKPNKPSCYTQAQWDARNSSKFNGAPFASPFPEGVSVKSDGTVQVFSFSRQDIEAAKAAVNAVPIAPCPNRGQGMNETLQNTTFPKVEQKEITIPCSFLDMKVWDGTTYFDMSEEAFPRAVRWQTCKRGDEAASYRYYLPVTKLPSASADYYIPVCGPGTTIQEITRNQMVELVWRAAVLKIDSASISASMSFSVNGIFYYTCTIDETDETVDLPWSINSSVNVASTTPNLNDSPDTPQEESNLVNLKWQTQVDSGFDVSSGGVGYDPETGDPYNITDPNMTGTSNINGYDVDNVTCTSSPETYPTPARLILKINKNFKREKSIYFVTNPSTGVEKIYLDFSKLFEFSIATWSAGPPGAYSEYYLDANNVLASHSINVNFFGSTVAVPISGSPNGTRNLKGRANNWTGGGNITTNFTNASVTIKGAKYYPYANSKGEAVYDVDTGAQLKDPLL